MVNQLREKMDGNPACLQYIWRGFNSSHPFASVSLASFLQKLPVFNGIICEKQKVFREGSKCKWRR